VGPFDGRPGPGKVGHKNAKTPPLVTFPQETLNPILKTIFWLAITRLAESVEGLNNSLAAAVGELWPKECRPLQWPARALQSFKQHSSFDILLFGPRPSNCCTISYVT